LTQPSKRFLAEENDPRAKRIVALLMRHFLRAGDALHARIRSGTLPPEKNEWSHFLVELRIGQTWIPADPTYSDEDCVAYDLPLQRFGYEPFLLARLMGMVIRGRSESIPFRRRHHVAGRALIHLSRGIFDHVNAFNEQDRARGRKVLREVGSAAVIQRRRHLYRRIPAVAEELGVALPPYPSS
jgi:hypothetical protein